MLCLRNVWTRSWTMANVINGYTKHHYNITTSLRHQQQQHHLKFATSSLYNNGCEFSTGSSSKSTPNVSDFKIDSHVELENEKKEFLNVLQDVINDLTHVEDEECDLKDIMEWYKQVLQYTSVGGRMTSGLSVCRAFKLLAPSNLLTLQNIHRANVLGWCVEMYQNYYIIVDDIIDGGDMRRGKLAWYRKEDLGLSAINDSVLVDSGIYKLLKKHFSQENYYKDLMEIFHEVTMVTAMGQVLDIHSCPSGRRPDLTTYTMERFDTITVSKGPVYIFYFPITVAMYMAGITDPELHNHVLSITHKIGYVFGVQNDYVDCFGDPNMTGKEGTDIDEGKCTWLSVMAIQNATKKQYKLMEQHYGIRNQESVNIIKQVYKDIGVPEMYHEYMASTMSNIHHDIQQLPKQLNPKIFKASLDNINRRAHYII